MTAVVASPSVAVLRGGGEPTGTAARTFREAVDRLDPVAAAEDAGVLVERLRAGSGDAPAAMVVIGPDVEAPLSAATELRRAVSGLELVFVVSSEDARQMEIRLGLMPELRGATVLAADRSAEQLGEALHEAARAGARRREVRGALDAMNRQLLQRREEDDAADRQSVSESYLAALTRHVPEAIVSVDRDGRIVAVNDAALGTFGLSPQDVEGSSFGDVLAPEENGELHRIVQVALEGETTSGRDLEIVVGDDRRLIASVTVAAVRDHAERIVGAVLLARDVTDQRRTEERLQQLQKAQSLATLASGVAHDFNNLLVSVKGWAEMAADEPGDTELVAEALAQIRVSADRAADLARAMLVYGGRGGFRLESADVVQVVRELAGLLHGTVTRKTDLVLDLPDDLPPVQADVTQLRQVVLNLITNAAEALGDDPGTITVTASSVERLSGPLREGLDPAPRYLVLSVADTGPGMDEATRRRVFEPFFSTKFEGRGLGLAASHGIVRAHGGALVVESEPGQGATFRMVLPAVPQDAA